MIFIVLWTAIFALLALYLLRSPKVRSWLSILVRAKFLWQVIICSVTAIAAIVVAYKLHPEQPRVATDSRKVFEEYAAGTLHKLDTLGRITLDSLCDLDHPKPELAYIMPLVLNTYIEIVEKPTKPVLTKVSDTLFLELRGYKQFKNRGIRLTRLLQKKLGNRYTINILNEGTTHTLLITYTGAPWDKEQLFALPVMEASLEYKVDPALLMSLIRHVSNFDFDFRGPKDSWGILALGSPEVSEGGESSKSSMDGLNQLFQGAQRLSKMLEVGISLENTIATFYPNPAINPKPDKWRQSPLIKSWVEQVINDIQFYHDNGL